MEQRTRPLRRATAFALVALTALVPTASAWIAEPLAPLDGVALAAAPIRIAIDEGSGQNVTWAVASPPTTPGAEPVILWRAQLHPVSESADTWTYTVRLDEGHFVEAEPSPLVRVTFAPAPEPPASTG